MKFLKNYNGTFHRNEQATLKFVWNHKRPWIAKTILRKKNQAGSIILPDFKLYYKVIVVKTLRYWHRYRHTGQQNRIESPEVKLHIYVQLIYIKGAKNTQREKDSYM